MADLENLFEVECLHCESCRREFPHAVFTSDTDMMTADLASLTALTRNEVILGRLTGAEYNLGAAGEPLFLARIARQLGRSDLSTIKIKRRETITHKPKVAFFGFPSTETIRIYHCPCCVEGEVRIFETMKPERFEAKGGAITVAPAVTATKSFKHLAPGGRYCVTKSFVDFDGASHQVGERWIYLSHSFLPHDDGLSLFVSDGGGQQWQIRLQWRDDQQRSIIENIEDYIQLAPEDLSPSDSPHELLSNGVVDQAMFDALAEAHAYDAASSMNFLNARLAALLAVLRRGVTLHLYDPEGVVSTVSERAYRAWAKKHFPAAVF